MCNASYNEGCHDRGAVKQSYTHLTYSHGGHVGTINYRDEEVTCITFTPNVT